MVTVGLAMYNSLLLMFYNYLTSTAPNAHLVEKYEESTIIDLVNSHGYQIEEHGIQTEDGYLLTLFRLGSQNDQNNNINETKRPPVLLAHGIQSSAYDFLTMGPQTSLPYLLLNQGYDIWLANFRGNQYSRKHIKFHPDEPRFWKFGAHEKGYYDIPAKIDYILNKTGYESLYYLGTSQGATSMFITASERPEYIPKIRLFIALGPVVFSHAMRNLLIDIIALFYEQVEGAVDRFGLHELFWHDNKMQQKVFRLICHENMPLSSFCRTVLTAFVGYSAEFQKLSLEQVLNSFPSGGSAMEILHFSQSKMSDRFCQYDHGPNNNLIKYGTNEPPDYNLETDIPTVLIYGDGDILSTEQNIDRISAYLKNLKHKQSIRGNHADYILTHSVTNTLLPILVDLLKNH